MPAFEYAPVGFFGRFVFLVLFCRTTTHFHDYYEMQLAAKTCTISHKNYSN